MKGTCAQVSYNALGQVVQPLAEAACVRVNVPNNPHKFVELEWTDGAWRIRASDPLILVPDVSNAFALKME